MRSCFGTIYPDPSKRQFNKEIVGKIFRMHVNSLGPGHRDPHLEFELNEWEECQKCEFYQSCLDFSNAKLAMQRVMTEA